MGALDLVMQWGVVGCAGPETERLGLYVTLLVRLCSPWQATQPLWPPCPHQSKRAEPRSPTRPESQQACGPVRQASSLTCVTCPHPTPTLPIHPPGIFQA